MGSPSNNIVNPHWILDFRLDNNPRSSDMGKRVECDDQWYMCYRAILICRKQSWKQGHDDSVPPVRNIYLRGCGAKAVFGEKN